MGALCGAACWYGVNTEQPADMAGPHVATAGRHGRPTCGHVYQVEGSVLLAASTTSASLLCCASPELSLHRSGSAGAQHHLPCWLTSPPPPTTTYYHHTQPTPPLHTPIPLQETKDFVAMFDEPVYKSVGSSLKLLMVAEGTAHIYPRLAPTCEWDTAAADIIVREAGGAVLQVGCCDLLQRGVDVCMCASRYR